MSNVQSKLREIHRSAHQLHIESVRAEDAQFDDRRNDEISVMIDIDNR
jgi:hypothetical protein